MVGPHITYICLATCIVLFEVLSFVIYILLKQ